MLTAGLCSLERVDWYRVFRWLLVTRNRHILCGQRSWIA